jgi:hypothetical protein
MPRMNGITKLAAAMTVSAALWAATTHAGNCPISECDYLDPQFKAALDAWNKCSEAMVNDFVSAMDQLAIAYPRFGLAWQSQAAEMRNASRDPSNPNYQAIMDEINRRFEDRILQTGEPDALRIYNLWTSKLKANEERCGAPPVPPKKHP